jgi:hypothetical protein
MTEGQISGYLLHMSHDDRGHTVHGAVIHKDNKPEANNETIAKASN